jgi:hypothetical protein
VDFARGSDGPGRIVLMGAGHPEHGHHRIAHELFDGALVAGDHPGDALEDAAHDLLDILGVERLGHGGVAGKIGKEHRDLLALAAAGGGVRFAAIADGAAMAAKA